MHSIILWLERFTKHLVGSNFQFNVSFFLFGIAQIKFSRVVFNRLWFVLCVAKFIIWKSRCIHVFQSILHPSDTIISFIVKEIKDRIKADRKRFSKAQFEKIWTGESSFVSLCGDNIRFKFL